MIRFGILEFTNPYPQQIPQLSYSSIKDTSNRVIGMTRTIEETVIPKNGLRWKIS